MPLKRKKQAARKSAASARRKVSKLKRPDISHEDVVSLELEASRHQRSERAWLSMTSTPPEEEDRWSTVEEHLVAKTRQDDRAPRRWKYFAK